METTRQDPPACRPAVLIHQPSGLSGVYAYILSSRNIVLSCRPSCNPSAQVVVCIFDVFRSRAFLPARVSHIGMLVFFEPMAHLSTQCCSHSFDTKGATKAGTWAGPYSNHRVSDTNKGAINAWRAGPYNICNHRDTRHKGVTKAGMGGTLGNPGREP